MEVRSESGSLDTSRTTTASILHDQGTGIRLKCIHCQGDFLLPRFIITSSGRVLYDFSIVTCIGCDQTYRTSIGKLLDSGAKVKLI